MIDSGEPCRAEAWLPLEHPWRVQDLAWSPDGSTIAYCLRRDDDEPEHFVAWASGSERGRVPGHALAWTPASKALLVADVVGQSLVRVTTSGKTELVCDLLDDGHPKFPPRIAVSPSGRRVAFTSRRFQDGLSEVWIADRKEGARLLTEIPGAQLSVLPFWSPRGVSFGMLVVHAQQEKSGIVLVPHLRGEGEIVHESDRLDAPFAPAWSPSTRSLVFGRRDGDGNKRLVALDCKRRESSELGEEAIGPPRFLDHRRLVMDGGDHALVLELGGEL
jgi:dipeptidyl aminopeptidase/acylaminoacyl peptidase